MQEPKKRNDDKDIPPAEMTYPTPPLDPKTGAPLDTRFAPPPAAEVAVEQPPKSGGEEEKQTRPKSSERQRRR